MIVTNPDKQRIYHCWHYCKVCGKSFSHHQSSWDTEIKSHKHFQDNDDNLISVSNNIDGVTI